MTLDRGNPYLRDGAVYFLGPDGDTYRVLDTTFVKGKHQLRDLTDRRATSASRNCASRSAGACTA